MPFNLSQVLKFKVLIALLFLFSFEAKASYQCEFSVFAYDRVSVFRDQVEENWSNFYGLGRYFYLVFFKTLKQNEIKVSIESTEHNDVRSRTFPLSQAKLEFKEEFGDTYFKYSCSQ